MLKNRALRWNTRAMPRRARALACSRVTSSPLNRIVPEEGISVPPIMLSAVLLPAPFGPMSAQISPSSTTMSSPETACRPPK